MSVLKLPGCSLLLLVIGSAPPLQAAEPIDRQTNLVDFERPQEIRLRPSAAESKFVRRASGTALEMTTEAAADYPAVLIEPATGKWDLRGYDAVTMHVENPEDVPLRVLLSIQNPGTDGRNKCNVESIRLAPRESGVLTVPFGMWHGEKNHPLDQSEVVGLQILLDKPGRAHRFVVDDLRAVHYERFDFQKISNDPFFQALQPPFGRGINLSNALDAPQEGEWGVTLEESYFEHIRRAGFDSVRLPVRWSAHAEEKPPYRLDPQFLARVDWAVQQALSRNLAVVLDVHHYAGMDERPAENRERFLAIWEQIAAHYRDRPPALAFELLNEPHDHLTANTWNAVLAEAIGVVRRTNPTRSIVVGPVGWNAIRELPSLELPEDDRNLIVTVHYYLPFAFTHQGAEWVDERSRPPVGTPWAGTPEERAAIKNDFDAAIAWAVRHRRPLYLGEFGAYGKADLDSRVRWTKFVVETAAERKIGWAYWGFCDGFGIFDRAKQSWIEPLHDALIPPTQRRN